MTARSALRAIRYLTLCGIVAAVAWAPLSPPLMAVALIAFGALLFAGEDF